MKTYFKTYEESRNEFLSATQNRGFSIESIEIKKDLFIDIAIKRKNENDLLVLTTGLHGIEGFIGSKMIHVFLENFESILSSDICLIHSINPYGMKNFIRNNENNVDLNRNFISNDKSFKDMKNDSYDKLFDFLNPKVKSKFYFNISFYYKLANLLIEYPQKDIKEAILKGQYKHSSGLYFGGNNYQKSSLVMKDFFYNEFSKHKKIVSIDLHSGFGKKYNMSIVNSKLEKTNRNNLVNGFGYKNIIELSKEDFYEIDGDFTDYQYRIIESMDGSKDFYGTCFEFGTVGNSLLAEIKSLKTMIISNAFKGDKNNSINKKMLMDLYMPKEKKWIKKASEDFSLAINGIINYYHLNS
jgi:hypothetical protein